MIKLRRLFAFTSIFALSFCATGAFALQNNHAKEVLGKWQGTGKEASSGDEQPVTVNFKQDGTKIIAEIYTQDANWTTDNVSFAEDKWTIIWTTPEGATGKVVGTIKENTMIGKWTLGDDSGTFELKKIVIKS